MHTGCAVYALWGCCLCRLRSTRGSAAREEAPQIKRSERASPNEETAHMGLLAGPLQCSVSASEFFKPSNSLRMRYCTNECCLHGGAVSSLLYATPPPVEVGRRPPYFGGGGGHWRGGSGRGGGGGVGKVGGGRGESRWGDLEWGGGESRTRTEETAHP